MRSLVGKVVSNKMQKSVVVAVDRFRPHPKYRKIVRKTRKFMAHDEANECNPGDKVQIDSCRPLSKHKAWTVTAILQRAHIFKIEDTKKQTGQPATSATAASSPVGTAGISTFAASSSQRKILFGTSAWMM